MRILIIEDNDAFRELLKAGLQTRFPLFEISETPSGTHALRMIQTCPPDLLFTDIEQPGGKGLEALKEIRTRYPKMVIAVLTGLDLPEYRLAAADLGVDHFLSRDSASIEDITRLIEAMLRRGASV